MKEYKYTIDGKEYLVTINDITENIADITVNGDNFKVEMEPEKEPEKNQTVLKKAQETTNEDKTDESTPTVKVNADEAVKAPLPGVITEIQVAVGDKVKAGDTLVILEAMKMANNIEAEKDGTVTAIHVKQGESVMEDTPLVTVQ